MPMFGTDGMFSPRLGSVSGYQALTNDIGTPGGPGFGVGICPPPYLPSTIKPLPGYDNPLSDTYGNYLDASGSVMCWVPAFFYRIESGSNNPVVVPYSEFPSVAAANAEGFALHRAFYDGGLVQPGFFVDKYKWSNGAGVAVSVKNGNPLSSSAAHNGWGSLLTGLTTADNIHAGAFKAAKTRGAAYFPKSLMMQSAIALLSRAHANASTSTTYCAWYAASGVSAPRGCDNNALRSSDDTSVIWQSDGYSNCGKTGSAGYGGGAGNVFAKSTHNGQNCGIADVAGLMYEVAIGMTCVATTKAITGATQANPCVLTIVGHGFSTGDVMRIDAVGGMTQLNGRLYTITVVDADHVSLDGVDATAFTAYTSGGTATRGYFYAAKPSVRLRDFTGGTTLATDHWGAAGVAAMMDAIDGSRFLQTAYGANNVYSRQRGNGAASAFRGAVSGADWVLDGLGLSTPASIGAGTNVFGNDYYIQSIVDTLCPTTVAGWNYSTGAGVWALSLGDSRAASFYGTGGRAGLYLL
jgi:hypothetical protein